MTSSVITQNRTMPVRTKEKLHHSWWRTPVQVILFFVLAVPLLEIYFRVAGVGGGEYMQPDLHLGSCHIPDKEVIWRAEGFSNNRMNSVGLRDTEHAAKKSDVYRIALLGDSLVEALQVDLNDTFGKVLETHLNNSNPNKRYETINFGCGGYSTAQEFVQYERERSKYKPDAIVLLYNRGDSMESVISNKDRKKAEARPYFYIDQTGQLKEDDSVLTANFDKLKPHPIRDWLRRYSTIYSVLNQTDFSLTLNEPRYRKIKGWVNSAVSWSTNIIYGFRAHMKLAPTKPRPYGVFGDRLSKRADAIRPYNEEHVGGGYLDQDEMVVTKALIQKLAQQAANNGQIFVLAVYPNIDHYAALTEQARQLKVLASENHFLYLDLSPSFLADPQPRSNFALYHFNKKGHITVANQLYKVF